MLSTWQRCLLLYPDKKSPLHSSFFFGKSLRKKGICKFFPFLFGDGAFASSLFTCAQLVHGKKNPIFPSSSTSSSFLFGRRKCLHRDVGRGRNNIGEPSTAKEIEAWANFEHSTPFFVLFSAGLRNRSFVSSTAAARERERIKKLAPLPLATIPCATARVPRPFFTRMVMIHTYTILVTLALLLFCVHMQMETVPPPPCPYEP